LDRPAFQDRLAEMQYFRHIAEGEHVVVIELTEGELGFVEDRRGFLRLDPACRAAIARHLGLAIMDQLHAILHDGIAALADGLDALERARSRRTGREVEGTDSA